MLKKSRGVSIAFLISHTNNSATRMRPSTDIRSGSLRPRRADSADGCSVRASTAMPSDFREVREDFSALPDRLVRLALPRRVHEVRLRARRQQGLQVAPRPDVDRELERGTRRTGQVAVLVDREVPDQAVIDLRLVDIVDHA